MKNHLDNLKHRITTSTKKLVRSWKKNAVDLYGALTISALLVGEPMIACGAMFLTGATMLRRELNKEA